MDGEDNKSNSGTRVVNIKQKRHYDVDGAEKFEHLLHKVYNDCVSICERNFGVKIEVAEKNQWYIERQRNSCIWVANKIIYYVKEANSIYPQNIAEYEERRLNQDRAIGCCFSLLTYYTLTMNRLKVPGNKNVGEIKTLIHEINSLKKWRKSDNKFKKNAEKEYGQKILLILRDLKTILNNLSLD